MSMLAFILSWYVVSVAGLPLTPSNDQLALHASFIPLL